jgi:hypothetical protein
LVLGGVLALIFGLFYHPKSVSFLCLFLFTPSCSTFVLLFMDTLHEHNAKYIGDIADCSVLIFSESPASG